MACFAQVVASEEAARKLDSDLLSLKSRLLGLQGSLKAKVTCRRILLCTESLVFSPLG